ncbi:hypothetical protein Slin14017_G122230 [Septoria linicola]|nr:hypothetical protein Slin14017_G122230 [Septoria linicola]
MAKSIYASTSSSSRSLSSSSKIHKPKPSNGSIVVPRGYTAARYAQLLRLGVEVLPGLDCSRSKRRVHPERDGEGEEKAKEEEQAEEAKDEDVDGMKETTMKIRLRYEFGDLFDLINERNSINNDGDDNDNDDKNSNSNSQLTGDWQNYANLLAPFTPQPSAPVADQLTNFTYWQTLPRYAVDSAIQRTAPSLLAAGYTTMSHYTTASFNSATMSRCATQGPPRMAAAGACGSIAAPGTVASLYYRNTALVGGGGPSDGNVLTVRLDESRGNGYDIVQQNISTRAKHQAWVIESTGLEQDSFAKVCYKKR